MRLVIASHVPLAPSPDGAWLAFRGIAEIAQGLRTRGWQVTLVGRELAVEHARLAVDGEVAVVALARGSREWREWRRAARAAATADAALVFMPSLGSAIVGTLVGGRAVMYAGGAWGLRDDFPSWRGVLERIAARRARALVVSGHGLADYFAPVARHVELAVPIVTAEVRERLRRPAAVRESDEPLRVLFVGWVNEKKGVHDLVDAVAGVPGASCRIVGPAEDEALVAAIREGEARGHRIEYAGFVDWPELGEHYAWANVLALPSYSEGFPRVAYEGAAYGLALVLTDVGGIPARLRSERDALLVPPGDRAGLREALDRLRDAELRARLAQAAHAALAAAFTEPETAAQLDRILRNSVLGMSGG